VFVDLTAAYDTVWHRGLTYKLLWLLPDRHSWSWRWLAIAALPLPPEIAKGAGNDASRTASHRDLSWCPSVQNLHLWPASHHPQKVCICWRPSNHACWWRLAGSGRGAEQGHGNTRWIPPDLDAKAQNHEKVSAVFHLNNKETKRELKVNFNNETLPFCSEPKYLGVTLDTYRRHLESLRKKLTSCVAPLRRLTGSGWGAGATTLRTATLALVHSTAEYCAPLSCRSAHTRLVDPTINDALRIVTGWLRPTPADNLPILAGIQPAELRRRWATLSQGRRAMEPGHLLHSALTVHWVQLHGASNRDTHLYLAHNNSVFLTTTTYVRRSGRIINGTRSGRTTPQDFALQFQTPVHTPPEWPSQKEPGSGSSASAPVSGVSAPVCTNGLWPPLRPVSAVQKNKPSTMSSSNVRSIAPPPRTTRPDCSGRWDSRMAVQHLSIADTV